MTATLEVDYAAQAAYLHLTDNEVVETCEVAPGVLVDVDEYRVVVGVEVLSLTADIPVEKLATKFHVLPADLARLETIRPNVTSFVSRMSGPEAMTSDPTGQLCQA